MSEDKTKNVNVCIICHECDGHIALPLSEFVKIMVAWQDIDRTDEALGFICMECLDDERRR